MVTIEDVRSLAASLPRTTEALVHGRVKFRVGRVVYEMRELVFDAWRMVVPKRVAAPLELEFLE